MVEDLGGKDAKLAIFLTCWSCYWLRFLQKSADWRWVFFLVISQILVKKGSVKPKKLVGGFVVNNGHSRIGCVADGHQGETWESLRLHGQVWNQPSSMGGSTGGVFFNRPFLKNPWWDFDQYQRVEIAVLKHAIDSHHEFSEILFQIIAQGLGMKDPKWWEF